MLKNILVIWMCMAIAITVQSQTDKLQDLKNPIPPSPNSAALFKYSEWPVNLYTGVPNISVPLYELKGRDLSVPITLSYHASGIKVGEIASSVGMGWVLNAGGVITRSIRGLPDEASYGGFFSFRTRYTDPNNFSSVILSPYTLNQNKGETADQQRDGELDVYSLNALGTSYKLIFKGDGSIITIPNSKLKITANFSADTWTVILEDGTRLNFGSSGFVEKTDNARADITIYTSSWMLKSVVSPRGETITFTYTTAVGVSQTASIFVKDRLPNNDNGLGYTTGLVNCSCDPNPGGSVGTGNFIQEQTIQTLLVSTIESDLTRVEFILDPSLRQDLYGGKYYSGMKVFSKLKNSYVEEYALNYSYSQAVASNVYSSSSTYYNYRLRLNSLYKNDPVTHSTIQKWIFDYNPQNLPSRVSYAQDHWGYFSGATQNTTFLPAIYTNQAIYDGFNPDNFPGASRDPNSAYMQAETLTKITYPTGGYSVFQFVPNSYPVVEETFTKTTLSNDLTTSLSSNPFLLQKSTTFTITKKQFIKLYLSATVSGLVDDVNMTFTAQLKNSSGTVLASVSLPRAGGTITKTFNIKQTGVITYEIKATQVTQADFISGDMFVLNSTSTYDLSQGNQSVSKLIGGLRINSIEDYESASSTPIKRSFVYESPLIILPFTAESEYLTTLRQQMKTMSASQVCNYEESFCYQDFLVRNSSTKSFAATAPIGYGKVTTVYGDNGINGKSISYFSSISDDGTTAASLYPYPPTESRDWQRGQLIMKTEYDASLNKINRTHNTYLTEYTNTITSLKSGRGTISQTFILGDPYKGMDVTSQIYNISTGNYKLQSTREVQYNGSDSIQVLRNYYYDNPNNLRAVRTETMDSKGQLNKTISRTPLEKTDINTATPLSTSASIAIDSMVNRNIISTVLQTEQYVGVTLINRVTTDYKVWFTNPLLVAPETAYVKIGSNAQESRVSFSSYDAKGNLLEQSKVNDAKRSYLYNYTFSYPIAEVVNAGNSSIAYTSFEADATGSWQLSVLRDNSNYYTGKTGYPVSSNAIRSGLDATVTYVVSFWAKNPVGVTVNGSAATAGMSRNGWTYYEKSISSATTVTITGTSGYIDELRLFPKNSLMTTYVYDPLVGVVSSTDPNNTTTFYSYDTFGRLVTIRDDQQNVLKTFQYNYKQ